MPKEIIYYVQRYRPRYEAISKEVRLLSRHFKGNIHDLHLNNPLDARFTGSIVSYHFLFYPLTAMFIKLFSCRYKIRHIYTNLSDTPYLPIINKKPTILTGAATAAIEKIKKRKRFLKKLSMIIVETKHQEKQLISLGINKDKIKLIRPTIDDNLTYQKPKKKQFTILYASCPTRVSDFKKRGIDLLIKASKDTDVNFYLAWRKKAYADIIKAAKNIDNIKISNDIPKSMDQKFSECHATIIPYTKIDNYLKLMPNSAIESLAAGKPVLISSMTELAELVKKERCGVVFKPNKDELLKAIKMLKANYSTYQKNCQKTFKKYFSQDIFLKGYEEIYDGLKKPNR